MKRYNLDEVDRQILDILIENARTPFTDIAKKLLVLASTVHVRVKKMEEEGIVKSATLILDYEKMGYPFIAHVGIYLEKTSMTREVIENLRKIPSVTVAHITAGKFNILCKIRTKNVEEVKNIIFEIDKIEGVNRAETMISLEESINDKKRIVRSIFRDY